MTAQETIYPYLVRTFYANMEFERRGGITSWVRGVEITLDRVSIAHILGFPRYGYSPSSFTDPSNFMSPLEQMRLLMNDQDLQELPPMKTYHLPARTRFLSRIISHSLLPKSGHFDEARWLEYTVMCHLLLGQPFDLGHLMIAYIRDTYTINVRGPKKFKHLPYGIFLTRIFDHFGVNLTDPSEGTRLRPSNFFSILTIQNMGFEIKEGTLVLSESRKKRRLDTPTEQQIEEEEVERLASGGASSSQAPRRPSGVGAQLAYLVTSLDRLSTNVATRFDAMETRIDTRFTRQDERLDGLATHISRFENSFIRRMGLVETSIEAMRQSFANEEDQHEEDEGDEQEEDEGDQQSDHDGHPGAEE